MLQRGANILIFPEKDEKHNNILYKFQENFIDIAKLYYKKAGIRLTFVPMYIAPALKKLYLCEPIRFCADNPIEIERQRICKLLKERITKQALALPKHRIVPYPNIPKKDYPTNMP